MGKENEKDLISRRNFFKKAAGAIIPAIALTALPSMLTSCEIDEPYPGEEQPTGCNSSCSNSCTGCKGSCMTTCQVICEGRCGYNCKGTCKNGCKSASR